MKKEKMKVLHPVVSYNILSLPSDGIMEYQVGESEDGTVAMRLGDVELQGDGEGNLEVVSGKVAGTCTKEEVEEIVSEATSSFDEKFENYYTKAETLSTEEIINEISSAEENAINTAKEYTNSAIGGITSFETLIVEELPETGAKGTIYLLPKDDSTEGYTEYLYINNAWEVIGSTDINLEDYYTKTEVDEKLNGFVDSSNFEELNTMVEKMSSYEEKMWELNNSAIIDNSMFYDTSGRRIECEIIDLKKLAAFCDYQLSVLKIYADKEADNWVIYCGHNFDDIGSTAHENYRKIGTLSDLRDIGISVAAAPGNVEEQDGCLVVEYSSLEQGIFFWGTRCAGISIQSVTGYDYSISESIKIENLNKLLLVSRYTPSYNIWSNEGEDYWTNSTGFRSNKLGDFGLAPANLQPLAGNYYYISMSYGDLNNDVAQAVVISSINSTKINYILKAISTVDITATGDVAQYSFTCNLATIAERCEYENKTLTITRAENGWVDNLGNFDQGLWGWGIEPGLSIYEYPDLTGSVIVDFKIGIQPDPSQT